MKKIAIYGAGGFGREVLWLAEVCNKYEVICFVDDNPNSWGTKKNGIPVAGFEDTKSMLSKNADMVFAIGSPKRRQKTAENVENAGFSVTSLIHPNTEMSRWIEISKGNVICAGCILTVNIKIRTHVHINLGCTIGHDVLIGDYTTLAPGVHVSGWVHLGKRVYVGTGAVIINGTEENPIIIGDDAIIGAGACVTKSIPPGETWVGVPAKPIKRI